MTNDENFLRPALTIPFDTERRRFLLGLGAAVGVVAIPASVWRAAAAHVAQLDQATADSFLDLSRRLTNHSELDPVIARRIYAALALQDSHFAGYCASMVELVRHQPLTTAEDMLTAVASGPPAVTTALHQIISAWYLGVVNEATDAEVIAYEKALMFTAVSDVLAPPSYCRAEPGYWTSKPPAA